MSKLLIECYHGTSVEIADKILLEGFHPDTWFATDVQAALRYGGKYIFVVRFDISKIPNCETCGHPGWQFHVPSAIPKSKIVALYLVQEISQKGANHERE